MSGLAADAFTFLFTDIEDSTSLWEQSPDAMGEALDRHDALLSQVVETHGGIVFKTIGDSCCAVFAAAPEAVAAAVAAQLALRVERAELPSDSSSGMPRDLHLRVRIALHTGPARRRGGDYLGPSLTLVARLLSAAHGGQTLLSQSTSEAVRDVLPPLVSLRGLGQHRLRGLSLPERIFQLVHPDLTADFPPLRPPAVFAHNIPIVLTSFIARERETTEVMEMLAHDRLVTLTGAGGSGKTRLALEVVTRLRHQFEGSIGFVPLVDLGDPRLIAGKVLDVLRLLRSPTLDPLDQLVAALSGYPVFLVLDNFEHLVTGGAPVVQALLERVDTLTCLVTSRQRLGLAGEREFRVPPLPVPHRRELLDDLMQCASVQLFVARSTAVAPAFQLTAANAAAVGGLCTRLEGLPLALELAAARSQVLTPAQMLSRLGRRFDLLVARGWAGDPRHRSLRAALDWSYQLLSPELRRFFAHLSVFRGGWTLAAAEGVCAEPMALEYVSQLQESSLVLAAEGGEEMRYYLQESVREYAFEQLSPLERAELARCHASYYLALAEQADPMFSGAERDLWLRRLDEDQDNLRTALAWSQTDPQGAETGLRLSAALLWFWYFRDLFTEGRSWLDTALAYADDVDGGNPIPGDDVRDGEPGDSALLLSSPPSLEWARAKALHAAGFLAWNMGDIAAAVTCLKMSAAISQQLGDKRGFAYALTHLGWTMMGEVGLSHQDDDERIATIQGTNDRWALDLSPRWQAYTSDLRRDSPAAVYLAGMSEAIFRDIGDRWGRALSLHCQGYAARLRTDYLAARNHFQDSLVIAQELGDQWLIALSLINLGLVQQDQGELSVARNLYAKSLSIERVLDHKWSMWYALNNLGIVALDQGDYGQARSLFDERLAIQRELGNKGGIAESLHCLGLVAQHQGDYPAAGAFHRECLRIYEELEYKPGIAQSLGDLGLVALYRGRHRAAQSLHQRCLAIYRDLEDKWGSAWSLTVLASIFRRQGDYGAAQPLADEGLAIRRGFRNKWGIAESVTELGHLALAQADSTTAQWFYQEGLALRRDMGNRRGVAEDLEGLAGVAVAEDRAERAARLFAAAQSLRDLIGAPLPPADRAGYRRSLAIARDSLGEATFSAAWGLGLTLSWEAAVTEALDGTQLSDLP